MVGAHGTDDALARYEVLAPLGSGGFASVHLARHRPSGREVALKVSDAGGDPELVARALNEARILASIRHPSLVDVFDYGALPDGRVFVAMDRIDGVSLEALLEHEGGKLAPHRAVRLAVQALSALEQVHAQGVVHRDIKPANLLVRLDAAGNEHLYVIDFGISKLLSLDVSGMQPATMMGAILGTPGYMAPEQIDARTVDARADVYGVAAVLYRAIAGRKPYETKTIDAWVRAVGEAPPPLLAGVAPWAQPALAQVIDRALARDRDARPQSARAMREALEAVLALDFALGGGVASALEVRTLETPMPPHARPQVPVHAPSMPIPIPIASPSTVSPRPERPAKRVPVVAWLAASVLVALGLAIAVGLVIRASKRAIAEDRAEAAAAPRASLARGAAAGSSAEALPSKLDEEEASEDADEVAVIPEVAPTPAAPVPRAVEAAPSVAQATSAEVSVADAPRRVRFVGAVPVGNVDMDEMRGYIRRALSRIDRCHDGTAAQRIELRLVLTPGSAPLVSPVGDQTDVGRCAASALVATMGTHAHSQGVLRDIVFAW